MPLLLTPCQSNESHQFPAPPDMENEDDVHQQFDSLGEHQEEGRKVEEVQQCSNDHATCLYFSTNGKSRTIDVYF